MSIILIIVINQNESIDEEMGARTKTKDSQFENKKR